MSKKVKTKAPKKQSQLGETFKRLRRSKLAMLGLAIVIVMVFLSVFADVITPYDFDKADYRNAFQYPSWEHPFGTDDFGRDLFTRCLKGGQVSLLVSLLSVIISTIVGGGLGAIASYFGGIVDSVIMRIMDILMAIPSMLLAMCISAMLGTGLVNTSIALACAAMPSFARVMRSAVITQRGVDYVEAARADGCDNKRILIKHIIPNCLSPMIVNIALRIGVSILTISSLSFVGLGVQPPTPEWGSILANGREYIREFYPLVTFPGLMIVICIIGFNLFADGLRDALDPRLKQ